MSNDMTLRHDDERSDYTDRMFERTAEVIRAWVKESLDADAGERAEAVTSLALARGQPARSFVGSPDTKRRQR